MRSVLVFVAIFVCLSLAAAQQTIAPGNKLSITVSNSKDLTKDYDVGPDGTIIMPFIGIVEVKGLTLAAAAAKIQKILGDQRVVLEPQVTVSFAGAEKPPSKASVSGAVLKPGDYQVDDNTTLDELLKKAEPTETADLASVRVTLSDGTVNSIDYLSFKSRGAAAGNPKIAAGSTIYLTIQPVAGDITVLGAVAKPGVIEFKEGMTLAEALLAAGGQKSDGDISKIQIKHRAGEQVVVDFATLGGNIKLAKGDQVFVPMVAGSSYVMVRGAVRNPGLVPYRDKMTLSQAIHGAGEPSDGAKTDKVEIKRIEDGKTVTTKADLNAVVRGQASDPEIQPGDTINVPYPSRPMSTQEFLRYGSLLITLLLLFKR
jgi:polysaccharide export outer membrane protein